MTRSVLATCLASILVCDQATAMHAPMPARLSISTPEQQLKESVLPPPAPMATWSEVSERPSAYRGKRLRLRVQFEAIVDTWNPYLTRFGTKQFKALQAWSDEQRLWVPSDFELPRVRLFFRRGNDCDWQASRAERYTRFEVEGVVREVFLDQPWIEIDRMMPLSEQVTEGTIIHAARAMDLVKEEAWDLALLEFEQALAGLLPEHFRVELEGERAAAHEQSREGVEERRKRPPIPQVNRRSD